MVQPRMQNFVSREPGYEVSPDQSLLNTRKIDRQRAAGSAAQSPAGVDAGGQGHAITQYREARKTRQAPTTTTGYLPKPEAADAMVRCARHLQQVCNKLHQQKKELRERVRQLEGQQV